jgi:hypothetical protein
LFGGARRRGAWFGSASHVKLRLPWFLARFLQAQSHSAR